jgi:6-phosphofructokinase 1
MSAARYLSESIQMHVDAEARETVLGYTQRGGSPSPMDRILATRYGAYAAECIAEGNFGTMVALIKNELTTVPLEEVGGKLRLVNHDHGLVLKARKMGVSFGDE